MVGTRRNKSAGGNDPDPSIDKPKKLTKAQLKQMDDVRNDQVLGQLNEN